MPQRQLRRYPVFRVDKLKKPYQPPARKLKKRVVKMPPSVKEQRQPVLPRVPKKQVRENAVSDKVGVTRHKRRKRHLYPKPYRKQPDGRRQPLKQVMRELKEKREPYAPFKRELKPCRLKDGTFLQLTRTRLPKDAQVSGRLS